MILVVLTIIGLGSAFGGFCAYLAHRRLDKHDKRIERVEQELGI